MTNEHWIVVETKPKAEHVAKFWLERAGYDCYLPLAVQGDDHIPKPLLPRYVFVDLDSKSGIWSPIASTIGCIGAIKIAGRPCRLPVRDIDNMRRREEAGVIRLRRKKVVETLKPGDPVRVHEGQFTGFDAVFDRLESKDRVRVFLTYVGGRLPVVMPRENVA